MEGRRTTEPAPILRPDGTVEYCNLLTATTPDGQAALSTFAAVLAATAVHLELGPGDVWRYRSVRVAERFPVGPVSTRAGPYPCRRANIERTS
jgi:hypothetical protein